MATKNNRRWPTPRTVTLPPGQQATGGIQYRVTLPSGKVRVFKDQASADAFIDSMLAQNPGYSAKPGWDDNAPAHSEGTTPQPAQKPTTPAKQPHFASEDLPVYIPNERKGIDRYIGSAHSDAFDRHFYGTSDWSALFGDSRVNGVKRAWQRNPEAMQLWTDAGNEAGIIASLPFAAYAATEAAPFVWQGGKWLLNTAGRAMLPSEWAAGAAQYLPRFAPQLQTAGQLGNATMAASLAGPGVVDLAGGIKEGDTNRALHGATDIAFSVPFLQEMRPLSTLANGQRAFSPAVTSTTPRATQVVDQAVFSPTARTTATAAAMGTPFMAAASDTQQENPQGSWYENLWSTVRNNPAETAFAGWLLWKGGKGLRNRYLREPAGRPAAFNEPRPTRGEGELYEPIEPRMEPEPLRENYTVYPEGIPEPTMPRPIEFTEPAPPKPNGLRPKKGKQAKEWDRQNQAYKDWETRRDEHNRGQEEARRAWDEYDYTPTPAPYVDEEAYNAAHADWQQNGQSRYDQRMAQYNQAVQAYQAEQRGLDAAHQEAIQGWEGRRSANEQAVQAYEAGEPYQKWLARRQNWRNRGQWVKDNWLGLGLGGWVVGSHLWGDNPSAPTNNPNNSNSNPVDSTVTLPAGFRPVQGVNDSTNQIVVPNSAGESDSIITIEPVTRNRFGRGGNQNQ